MDIIVTDHSIKNLEEKYENCFIYQTEHFSIMAEETEIPWLQFIPNQEMTPEYAGFLYGKIYRIAELLAGKEFGTHYNIAKIDNKLPYYHIHLIFRKANDECWPNTIWNTKTKHSIHKPKVLKKEFEKFLSLKH